MDEQQSEDSADSTDDEEDEEEESENGEYIVLNEIGDEEESQAEQVY